MKKALSSVLGLALLALLAWGIWQLFPSDEEIIRKRLAELAEKSSIPANQSPFLRQAAGEQLREYFAQEVVIHIQLMDGGVRSIQGRAELMEMVRLARANLREARIRLLDVSVQVHPERSAAATRMTLLADIDGEQEALVQELKMDFVRPERDWLISKIETVQTLKRLR